MKYFLRLFSGLFTLFLLLSTFGGCGESTDDARHEKDLARPRAIKVSVVLVKPVLIRDILTLPGETEAWQDLLISSDTAGIVEWIGPAEGEGVQKGQLMAKIDVSSLKAALDRAEAASKLADELYMRRLRLFERSIITKEELDRSLAEKVLAGADLRQARVEYERGFILSPITGVVNRLYVDEGEFTDRGKTVADIVNVDKIKINVNMPELDVRHIKVGQAAMVRIDAFQGKLLHGKIGFVAYKADPATKTFQVRVLIDNPEMEIRPGMIARVVFLRRSIPDALTAPLFAMVDKGGERILFVEKDGVAHARSIAIGVIEGDRVQITKGLKEGDHLIVTGQTKIEEGTRVQVQ